MKSNVERFDEITGDIFAHLYLNFPVEMSFDYSRWGYKIDEDYWQNPNSDQAKKGQRERDIIDGTFRFLEKSGYITYTATLNGGYINVTLTEKALLSLKKHPDSLTGSKTFGDVIAEAFKEGAQEKMKDAVGAVMTAAFASLTGGSI
ncbi:hypothetical protein [Mixta calida]|uniref:hypothetical protein n=1 Tax=Mixta calida TaxID=665913 RepID=UPI0028982E45|nr:hypothetical protein [Mixta calida]